MSDDEYSENDEKSKISNEGCEVRGSRTNCKGHWSKEEVSLVHLKMRITSIFELNEFSNFIY